MAGLITEWNNACGKMLHRLMCYISSTLEVKLQGFIGDPFQDLTIELYADADLASCKGTAKSTSGVLVAIGGPHSFFALNWISNKQMCQSHSTAESGITAADIPVRAEDLPAIQLWETMAHMMIDTPTPGMYEQRFGSDIISWTVADIVADENNKRIENVYVKRYLHEDNPAAETPL